MNLIALTQTDAAGVTASRILINPAHVASISGRFIVGYPQDGAEIKLAVSHSWRSTIVVTESVDTVAALLSDSVQPRTPNPRPADLVVTDALREQYDLEGDAEEIMQQILDVVDGMTAHDVIYVMQTLVRYARQEV